MMFASTKAQEEDRTVHEATGGSPPTSSCIEIGGRPLAMDRSAPVDGSRAA
jgi:hypothetical protein